MRLLVVYELLLPSEKALAAVLRLLRPIHNRSGLDPRLVKATFASVVTAPHCSSVWNDAKCPASWLRQATSALAQVLGTQAAGLVPENKV